MNESVSDECREVLCLVALCCERGVATIRFSKYESNGIALGLLLFILTIAGVVIATFYVYDLDDFNTKSFSNLAIPPGAAKEYNQISLANIPVSLICFLTLQISLRINKKQCSISCTTLTSRYQKRENIVTTDFAAHIAALQV
ncbi:hypothetical protein DICVIV_05354 [Dictyocaulus viviparus]|uniref:Uncharacterized protein n=1 Tax=Dictyocaulus viviparus TaxID=29172 RepID=A0A0D8XXL0_DICVI|nr:hypothetical protein DICVIV_05354 [Dictyocaulus viviparus]